MNEASTGRFALAQAVAPYYYANPKVAAVAVTGSVARGYADRFSDLDLAVYWSLAPTDQERRAIIERARGRHVQLLASYGDEACWSNSYKVDGFAVDVQHMDVKATRRILADVLERADPSLSKQRHLATLLSALPLADSSAVLTAWQSRAQVYPSELSVAMLRAHLRFLPAWEQEQLAERNELLAIGAAVVAGLVEETIFRGYVMTTLGRMGYGLMVQVLLSGLFFALVHFYAFAAPLSVLLVQGLTFVLGVALAITYAIGKRSLTPVNISHALIDVIIEPWLLLGFFQ